MLRKIAEWTLNIDKNCVIALYSAELDQIMYNPERTGIDWH
jgi:hypothetical protein